MRKTALALLLSLAACEAQAGAWTQDKGHWQVITSFEGASADAGYGADGHVDPSIKFDKLYLKSLIEYGWRDGITLFAQPEFVMAKSPSMHTNDVALESGVRMRISRAFGVLSLQASYKTAGPSDLSNSQSADTAQITELRILYGTNFHLLGRDGFADVEMARRWITRPRPNETVLDGTLGFWLGPKSLAMLQSFNVVSGGGAELPYTDFRNHKIELSFVRCLSPRWSVQIGAFSSPAGKNSLVEQGVETALWLHL